MPQAKTNGENPAENPAENAPQTPDAPQASAPTLNLTDGDPGVAEAIQEAQTLEAQRGAIMKRVADNREFLRLMDRREKLTEDQGAWLDAFYPEKEKGSQRSADDIARTKALREAARKQGVAA